ncbi:MAG TPA: Spo0E family sporulation regulatory protein-aspartic acid phosphatase [Tepidimicrobium sp.]|nr:Spo0E family sporulation regulatory protein-aspartic acid phosphatase [Tepidimicrobium sp.]
MEDRIESLRNLLYKKIETKEKDQEELIQISKKLDMLILKYYQKAMKE